ncbi:colanic acid/amylovoran biosynthesis glycosyltransferase [Gelidibacter sediminis]|uniref:Colanic acid/amylovoran biosynthesis glycosyltransferase n=1 Tax=Gelidibacter sediminis TaxID=1608710 RepID=A0A4R7PKL5_9FLAO|nr:glycosyltransferase family 4 protein [Gelidibacter sediminis]TDU34419.1 colanic acid/amylovoran biosynthesis glycosyltransferase [Gelidibacter sediminis]
MKQREKHTQKIGLVMSSVPGYSETFFRNKIQGLQDSGFEVILFVDYLDKKNFNTSYKIIGAKNYGKSRFMNFMNGGLALITSCMLHPRASYKHYQLDKKDGVSFSKRIKNLMLNAFLLRQKLEWLHFGFGMLAKDRENVAEAIGAQMAVSFRGYDLYLSPLKHPDCYDSLFLKKAKYHVLSEEMKQTLMEYSIDAKNIRVITPAIDTDFFQNDHKPQVRKFIEIITVARLHWKKGLEYTLEALALLKESGLSFRYTVIGDGIEKERLMFAAHQLGLSNQVIFKGKLSPNEIKKQLSQSDIYVQYSIQEGFCNAVLEAQAMGLLCIVSNAEGLAENVLDKHTGWVVEKRQPIILAQKIEEVIALSVVEKQSIRERAVDRVRNQFSLTQQQQKFQEFYTH